MKQIALVEKRLTGLSIRTNNAKEMQAETAKIGELHQTFSQKAAVKYEQGACLYGVYHQYESDHSGDFTVLVGAETDMVESDSALEHVFIPAGDYLVFSAEGDMPQAVIEVWGQIWHYFADATCPHARAFSVDFECYTSESSVDVYIAVE
ncbi:GyrI-like domain-containing protein [Marinomonas algicola]|uniref:GyrI-like domain-containing protein n=1 Tax=Marinomonas algicola TaxID=2773454 RepID=UPI00174E4E6A|nr:GyrI-like domain-containing protein [Marinomonas algicola]